MNEKTALKLWMIFLFAVYASTVCIFFEYQIREKADYYYLGKDASFHYRKAFMVGESNLLKDYYAPLIHFLFKFGSYPFETVGASINTIIPLITVFFTPLAITFLGREHTGNIYSGIIAGFIWLFGTNLPTSYVNELYSEALFMLLFLTTLTLLIKYLKTHNPTILTILPTTVFLTALSHTMGILLVVEAVVIFLILTRKYRELTIFLIITILVATMLTPVIPFRFRKFGITEGLHRFWYPPETNLDTLWAFHHKMLIPLWIFALYGLVMQRDIKHTGKYILLLLIFQAAPFWVDNTYRQWNIPITVACIYTGQAITHIFKPINKTGKLILLAYIAPPMILYSDYTKIFTTLLKQWSMI